MTKKQLAARDKAQREKIEQWAETTDWPPDVKRAFVELTVGFDKAKFMSLLPSEEVHKLMALLVLRQVAADHPPEERRDVLERFCAERDRILPGLSAEGAAARMTTGVESSRPTSSCSCGRTSSLRPTSIVMGHGAMGSRNRQPPDFLMQLLEYFFARNGVMKVDAEADVRPAEVLLAQLLAQLGEIVADGGYHGEEPPNS